MFKCDYCEHIFSRSFNKKRHILRSHTKYNSVIYNNNSEAAQKSKESVDVVDINRNLEITENNNHNNSSVANNSTIGKLKTRKRRRTLSNSTTLSWSSGCNINKKLNINQHKDGESNVNCKVHSFLELENGSTYHNFNLKPDVEKSEFNDSTTKLSILESEVCENPRIKQQNEHGVTKSDSLYLSENESDDENFDRDLYNLQNNSIKYSNYKTANYNFQNSQMLDPNTLVDRLRKLYSSNVGKEILNIISQLKKENIIE